MKAVSLVIKFIIAISLPLQMVAAASSSAMVYDGSSSSYGDTAGSYHHPYQYPVYFGGMIHSSIGDYPLGNTISSTPMPSSQTSC